MAPEIEKEGIWWDYKNPEKKWVGKFIFDSEGGGALTTTFESKSFKSNHSPHNYKLIHGLTSSGERFSLIDCFDQHWGISSSGIARLKIFVNRLICGFHAQEPDPELTAIETVFRSANQWYKKTGFSLDFHGDLPNIDLKYRSHETVKIVENDEFAMEMRPSLESIPMGT